MRQLSIEISYGGFVGCTEVVEFEVEDDASQSTIFDMAEQKFIETIQENCNYEIFNEDGDVIA